MTKAAKTTWDFGWSMVMWAVYAGSAWGMALAGWVYPPVPMFITALVGGWLYRGRPQVAARTSLWIGFLWGWTVEWAYAYVRLSEPSGAWLKIEVLERFGLGVAEITLYTALLSFFSAFMAWGSDQASATSRFETVAHVPETPAALKMEIPFQPEEPPQPNNKPQH